MENCPVCTKHRAPLTPIITSGEHAVLVHYPCGPDSPTVYKGHLFVESRRHVTSFADLSEEEAAEMGRLMAHGGRLLKEHLGAEQVYVFTIGHIVPHLHVHLVPRYPNTPKDYWGGWKLGEWPEAPRLGPTEVDELSLHFAARSPKGA